MKAEGKRIAYGVTRCHKGHGLRNRYGTCIECFPATIGFARRSELAGYVYVAESKDIRLFKIGFSGDPDNRISIANGNLEGYGGAWDWQILLRAWSGRAGAVEIATHRSLAGYQTDRDWVRNGSEVVATELFDCNLQEVINALKEHLSFEEIQNIEYY
jgi:T5orf172 domain